MGEVSTMTAKKRKNWICDFCHEEKDTLYFHGKKQICEECRKGGDKNGSLDKKRRGES